MQATESILASSITGLPGDEVRDVTLANIYIQGVLPSRAEWIGREVPEKESAYPEARMFGMLPTSGLYVRHARGLTLDRLAIAAPAQEGRPTILFDDVEGARITALTSSPVGGSMPIVSLENSRNVTIAATDAPAGTGIFLGVSGSGSSNVVLDGDNLRTARHAYALANDVPPGVVSVNASPSSQ